MTTTDTDALTERIAAALTEHWRAKHTATGTPCSGCTAAVLSVVAEEVRKAMVGALREAAGDIVWSAETLPHMTPQDAARGLVRRADRIEAGGSDDHR